MITGRVWKFGDNINTDLIVPGPMILLPEEDQIRAVFAANRPGWVDLVRPGDIIVAGKNFGVGSSRPAARSLKNLGIAALVAESINGLFLRTAVNFGFLALECPGAYAVFEEGQAAELSTADWALRNLDTGIVMEVTSLPPELLSLMLNGGIFPALERDGLIAPRPSAAAR